MFKNYALLGRKLGHSISPTIHELIFKYTNLEGQYKLYPMEEDKIETFVKELVSNNISGLNVTIPYKSDIIPFLDGVSDEAKKIGAVNTILPTATGLFGHNTDYFGVMYMLASADIKIKNKKIVVLGSGGSARTVVTLLKDFDAGNITIVSRNKTDAKVKFNDIKIIDYSELDKISGYELLINTTPVGMYPNINGCPLDGKIIKNFSEVVDLIYNPNETKLLSIAKESGLKYVNGLYMLVAQAVKAQTIWNDCIIPDTVIDKIYNDLKES